MVGGGVEVADEDGSNGAGTVDDLQGVGLDGANVRERELVVTEAMVKVLEKFHHQVVQMIAGASDQ